MCTALILLVTSRANVSDPVHRSARWCAYVHLDESEREIAQPGFHTYLQISAQILFNAWQPLHNRRRRAQA